jgi:hypothetical protein
VFWFHVGTVPVIAEYGMPVKFVPVSVGVVDHAGVVPPTRTPLAVASSEVAPRAVWYGIEPAAPPAMLVAVVALVAVAALPVVF